MNYLVKVYSYFSILLWLLVWVGCVGVGFILSGGSVVVEFDVFSGVLGISIPFMADMYSCLFSFVVILISSCVMLYNGFYMDGEVFYSRFCKLVLLFVMFMLLLVTIPNLLGLMLGWDGLGITSYLLVIYYQDKRSLGSGTLTVLSNRVGDVLFFMGIGLGSSFSSWGFSDFSASSVTSLMCGVVVLGCMTKSAQMPFSAWLPAAMAAPSPVSALVHSSTLVTAGVYVLVRFSSCVFGGWYLFLGVVCSMTMLMSAISAVYEFDVKKVVALSTLSQLGVMMLALSIGAVGVCFFHMVSHALFKALMFLCVGGVIHFSGVQDLRYLGGFLRSSPLVMGWLMVACLSLMGFPFLSGFYSKDLVLESFVSGGVNGVLFFMVIMATCLTGLYSGLMIYSLWGSSMTDSYKGKMISSFYVTIPCSVLGFGGLVGGMVMQLLVLEFNGVFMIVDYMKLVPISCVCVGVGLTVFYVVSSVGDSYGGVYYSNLEILGDMGAKMWFMPFLSSDLFSGVVLKASGDVKSLAEDGYLEFSFGGEGVSKGGGVFSSYYMGSQVSSIGVCFTKAVMFMLVVSFIYGFSEIMKWFSVGSICVYMVSAYVVGLMMVFYRVKYIPRYNNKVLRLLAGSFYDLPCPINLNVWWNFGSMLGVLLVIQIMSGVIMACHYTPHEGLAFSSVVHILHDVNQGWFFRSLHSNGASFFFMCIYAHIGRGLYYHSFFLRYTWMVGVSMYLLLMAIAFMGYVLPWGQMSYWGATVITNLFSAVPYVGNMLTQWIWGGYSVCDATLKRFYVLHMYLPFVLGGLALIHLYYLHESGSNNPLGVEDGGDLIPFHPYYSHKDFLGILAMVGFLLLVVFFAPDMFGCAENFIPANAYKTPLHIQPEWYFLFAYAILRSVPNKGGGVAALAASVLVLYFLPFRFKGFHLGLAFYPASQVYYWVFVSSFLMLTFVGMRPAEYPYQDLGRVSGLVYFSYFFFEGFLEVWWDYMIVYIQFSFFDSE